MKTAHVLIRQEPHYRSDAFNAGVKRLGYTLHHDASRCDVLITWNRHGHRDALANSVLARGGKVIVVENGYLGNDVAGDRWYTMSRNQHNGAGFWPTGDGERWASMATPLLPFRGEGSTILVLPQRGIGPKGVAMPGDWVSRVMPLIMRLGMRVRVRAHPGTRTHGLSLEDDLKGCSAVVTWGSGAAIKALALGVPVYYGFEKWVMAACCRPLQQADQGPLISCEKRLAAFQRMAWSQWRVSEIADGTALSRTLEC